MKPDRTMCWMMTGWGKEVGQANGARGEFRSRVRGEFGQVDPWGRRGAEGRFGGVRPVRREGEVGSHDRGAGEGRRGERRGGEEPVAREGLRRAVRRGSWPFPEIGRGCEIAISQK